MCSKIWFLQFFSLLLVSFACTPKKTALDQYFEGVTWEGVNAPAYELKIKNCRYQYKGELGEAATRLEMVDDKRLRMNHQGGDTFFVSIFNWAEKKILVLHDSLNAIQFFKSAQLKELPTLDNHDKIDLGSLGLSVSIGEVLPLNLLQYPDEYTQEDVKSNGIKRSGALVSDKAIVVDLSSENRILSITQSNILPEAIPNLVAKLSDQLGFPPNQAMIDTSDENRITERVYTWKLVGLTISLYLDFNPDGRNQKLDLAGKLGRLIVRDDFLTQVEVFKANFLNQN